ncbi:MAG TPA: ComEC/Rec2 family competence protein, partial [Bacillales bacterium]|nr:ComEC/Rec2 family competence protein [Bacillales bacterium]
MRGKWHFAAWSAVLGIVAAAYAGFYAVFILISITVLLLAAVFKKRILPLVCTFLFILLFCDYLQIDNHNVTVLPAEQSHFTGHIVSIPILDGNQFTFSLKSKSGEKLLVVYYLDRRDQIPYVKHYRYGMSCRLTGELKKPKPASNFYAFDYREYLRRQHVHWQLTPDDLTAYSCIDRGYSLFDHIQQWRGSGIRWIEHRFPPDVRGISEALMFGWKQNIAPEVLTAYRNLGLIHLLAVSGLHVGLIIAVLHWLLIRSGLTKERSLESLFLIIPFYILMTGDSPSVVRAGFMAMIVLASLRFRLRLHALDAISWAALAMLLVNPYQLFQTGFQLSFLISFALIVSAPFIMERYKSRFAQVLAVSVLSQIVSFPILIAQFYQISAFSLPLNLIYIPFITFFVLPLVFVCFFVSLTIPFLAGALLGLLNAALHAAHGLLLYLDGHSWGMLLFGKPGGWLVFSFYVVIAFGLLKWENRGGARRLIVPTLLFG